MMTFLKIFAVSLMTSYGLSVVFWLAFGVFNLPGFIMVSAAAALIGAVAGWLMKKSLLMTILVTAVIRIAFFLFMTNSAM